LCQQGQISFIVFVNSKTSTTALGAILPDLDGSINWERAEIKLSLHKQANAWNQPLIKTIAKPVLDEVHS
jgi:hypothetical protein